MLTSSYPRFAGDLAGTFVQSLAVELASLGHEVHVTMPADGQPARRLGGVVEHPFDYAPTPGLRVMGYAKSLASDRQLRPVALAMTVPYALAGLASASAIGARHRCDVVHAHWVLPNGPVSAAAASALGRPMVISLHGSDVYLAEKAPPLGALAAWAMRRAHATAACSHDLARRAVALGAPESRIHVVPYGVSLGLFGQPTGGALALRASLGLSDDDLVVVALGRMVDKKGFAYLVDAMPELLRRAPSARLVLAGDGALYDALAEQARRLGVGDAVRMPGRIDWRDVPALLATADVFVQPSVEDADGNVDGLPNTLLEAMAAGRPIVATEAGGIGDVVTDGQTGVLVPQRSSAALADPIARLLGDAPERRRLGGAARRLVEERLTWRSVARRYVELYETALDRASVGSPR
jgi:glycosyltransferase involved in cell wall biosynthesis